MERPAGIENVAPLRQQVWDHLAGRRRMPLTFAHPDDRLAFWDAVSEVLDEPQSTFVYWGELRAHRKREMASIVSPTEVNMPPVSHNPEALDSGNAQLLYTISARSSANDPSNTLNIQGQRSTDFQFPLSLDHKLFVLIQHNALRGAMTNMAILIQLNNNSIFQGYDDFYTEDLAIPEDAPASLQATHLQRTVPHDAWIDIIPYPALRDNIISRQASIDTDEICDDFVGGMYDGLSEVESRGLILWGIPWSMDGWEISEGFARKWSFLLEGCGDLIESTNKWRDTRGDERLVVEV